jgi:hypothetical protein
MIRAFDIATVNGVPLLDDFAFCHRWQTLCKGELWARMDQSVTHIGLHKFRAAYSDGGFGGPVVKKQALDLVKLAREAALSKSRTAKSSNDTRTPRNVRDTNSSRRA